MPSRGLSVTRQDPRGGCARPGYRLGGWDPYPAPLGKWHLAAQRYFRIRRLESEIPEAATCRKSGTISGRAGGTFRTDPDFLLRLPRGNQPRYPGARAAPERTDSLDRQSTRLNS